MSRRPCTPQAPPRQRRLPAYVAAGSGGGLVVLAYALAGMPPPMSVGPDDRWPLFGCGIALAVLGWWAAWLGPAACTIYRATMAALAAGGAGLWLMRSGWADPVRHAPVLATLGGVGLAFGWIPAGVLATLPPSRPRAGRHARR